MPDRWNSQTTELLRQWAAAYDASAHAHAKLAQLCLIGHAVLAAPAVVLPMLFPSVLPADDLAQGFLACSIMAGLLSFANFAGLAQRHRTSYHAYVTLRTDVVTEMSRPIPARRQPELAVADFRSRALQILSSSPSIPIHCSCCPWQLPPSKDFPEEPDVVKTADQLPTISADSTRTEFGSRGPQEP
jgi:hypothetical protein